MTKNGAEKIMNHVEKRQLILHGNMKRVILTLALPVMLNNFIQTLYNLTDTFFVGQIGGNEVAGVQFVWPLIFLVLSFGIGMSVATSSLIAQHIGAGSLEKAKRTAGQAILFLFFLSIVLGGIGAALAGSIVRWMGATGSLYENGATYLRIMFLGMPTTFMINTFNAVKQGQGDTVSPMILGGVSVVFNIILDPIFIFVLGYGIAGAAYATVIAKGVFAAIGIASVFSPKQSMKIDLADLKPDLEYLEPIVKVGLPSSLGQATTALGFTILNVFLVAFGDVTLTAFAVGNRVSSLIMMPAMGIGSALATVVGQNLGADDIGRARSAVRNSLGLSIGILLIGGSIMFPFSERIVEAFIKDPETVQSGTEYLRMIILGIPLMGIFQILIGTFQGSGHTLSAMVIMMGRLWGIRIPVVMYMSRTPGFSPSYIWYAMIFSNLVICLIGTAIYATGRWQHKVVEESAVEDEIISEPIG